MILREQEILKHRIPVDITLHNGNIFLRAFHLLEYDEKSQVLKGLTQQEEYTYLREEREAVYCYIKLSEVKNFSYEIVKKRGAKDKKDVI